MYAGAVEVTNERNNLALAGPMRYVKLIYGMRKARIGRRNVCMNGIVF